MKQLVRKAVNTGNLQSINHLIDVGASPTDIYNQAVLTGNDDLANKISGFKYFKPSAVGDPWTIQYRREDREFATSEDLDRLIRLPRDQRSTPLLYDRTRKDWERSPFAFGVIRILNSLNRDAILKILDPSVISETDVEIKRFIESKGLLPQILKDLVALEDLDSITAITKTFDIVFKSLNEIIEGGNHELLDRFLRIFKEHHHIRSLVVVGRFSEVMNNLLMSNYDMFSIFFKYIPLSHDVYFNLLNNVHFSSLGVLYFLKSQTKLYPTAINQSFLESRIRSLDTSDLQAGFYAETFNLSKFEQILPSLSPLGSSHIFKEAIEAGNRGVLSSYDKSNLATKEKFYPKDLTVKIFLLLASFPKNAQILREVINEYFYDDKVKYFTAYDQSRNIYRDQVRVSPQVRSELFWQPYLEVLEQIIAGKKLSEIIGHV